MKKEELIKFLNWYHIQENHLNDATIEQIADVYIKKTTTKNSYFLTIIDHCEKCNEFDKCWKDEKVQRNCTKYSFL